MWTLRQIQRELRANWRTVSKIINQLGIKPQRVGRIVLITDEEFKLIKDAHAKISKPKRNYRSKKVDDTVKEVEKWKC